MFCFLCDNIILPLLLMFILTYKSWLKQTSQFLYRIIFVIYEKINHALKHSK